VDRQQIYIPPKPNDIQVKTMKTMGILTVIFGLIVLIAPWVSLGAANLQYVETLMGILVLIMGAMSLK
jgi:uncharacterized membrane protein HdeD (DUF308 family)